MANEATVLTDSITVRRGGGLSVPHVTKIENTVVIGGVAALAGADKSTQIFTFEGLVCILAIGIEQVVPCTNAITASLGKGSSAAGSKTDFLGETSVDDTAGDMTMGAATAYPQVVAPESATVSENLDLEVSGDPGAAGTIRVWAIIADVRKSDGS